MKNKIIIIGASGHGKVVADIAEKVGYKEIAFLDDNEDTKKCGKYPVIGKSLDAIKYKDSDFIVGIGNNCVRKQIQEYLLNNGLNVVKLIHPNAVIAPDVSIGIGTVIVAGAVINSNAKIGQGCIVNTGSTIDHDDTIGDFVHISVGCHIAGTVNIADNCWLCIGSVISNNLSICANCTIGAGAVVVNDIVEQGTYVGVPAKLIKGNKD